MMMLSVGGYSPPEPSRAKRKVSLASKGHFTGHLVVENSANGRVVVVESHLEMLWAVYLLALPGVDTIVEQVAFDWVDENGEVHTKYFDFLVLMKDGKRLACEVKPTVRLQSGRVVNELRQIRAQLDPEFADEVRLLTEKGLDPVSLHNAEMFIGMRETDVEADEAARSAVRALNGALTMENLTRQIGLGARGFRALVRLIAAQVLRLAKHERIAPETLVLLKENI